MLFWLSYKPYYMSCRFSFVACIFYSLSINLVRTRDMLLKPVRKLMISNSITDIGLMIRVFANDPGDLRSIPGRVIPKIATWCLFAQHSTFIRYGSRVKSSNPRKRVAPFPTPWLLKREPSSHFANFTFFL